VICRALPPHPLAFASFKLLQICLARKKEFEEGFPLKAACLFETKQHQIIFGIVSKPIQKLAVRLTLF
jgi:hypothetical protein